MVAREIRARYSGGKIEPLEDIELEEGAELTIVVKEQRSPDDARAAFLRSAGGWRGTLDFDAFLADLREARKHPGRDVSL